MQPSWAKLDLQTRALAGTRCGNPQPHRHGTGGASPLIALVHEEFFVAPKVLYIESNPTGEIWSAVAGVKNLQPGHFARPASRKRNPESAAGRSA